jgi:O-antigen/teichoic acid export membrane protein
MNNQLDRVEERFERQLARQQARGNQAGVGTVVAGMLLILLGVVYLLQNAVNFSVPVQNWEALFILIPVFMLFDRAFKRYRNAGNRMTSVVWGAGFFGIILLVLTGIILFELDTDIWGPIIIILAGIGILVGAMIKTRDAQA